MKLDEGGDDVDSLVGETAVAQQDIPAGEIGRVELRGTSWSARNRGARAPHAPAAAVSSSVWIA